MATDDIAATITKWGRQGFSNLQETLASMSLQKWLRLVVLVCAYLLLKRYLLAFIAKRQAQQHALDSTEGQLAAGGKTGPVASPNEFRVGGTRIEQVAEIPEDSSDEEGEGGAAGSGADWGKNARRRQRRVLRKLVDEEEKRLLREQGTWDEDDKDIEEFLVD